MALTRRHLLAGALTSAAALSSGGGLAAALVSTRLRRAVSDLNVDQLVGQLFAVGVPFGDVGTAGALAADGYGTIFWSGRSADGEAGLAADNEVVQRRTTMQSGMSVRVFTALDQEGGAVQSLRGAGISDIPSALEQGQSSTDVIERRSATWSRQLRRSGFTMNLAPIAGVVPYDLRDSNQPIGRFDREFGYDGSSVGAAVAAWVRGSRSAGVQPVLKHFPGLGRASGNTDTKYLVHDDVTEKSNSTLTTWRAGVLAGAGTVMVSHAIYTKIDPARQAFRSERVIKGFLRGGLGFRGIVMSDDLADAAAVRYIPVADRAVEFIEAGGDLPLAVSADTCAVMRRAVADEARRSETFQKYVRASASRVLALKAKNHLVV